MPSLLEIHCTRCGHSEEVLESGTWLVKDDDSRLPLTPPSEIETAEQASGLSWKELTREGRIRYSSAATCWACGRTSQIDLRAERYADHVTNLVLEKPVGDFVRSDCPHCGEGPLRPSGAEPMGPLAGFSQVLPLFLAVLALIAWAEAAADRMGTTPTRDLPVAAPLLTLLALASGWVARRTARPDDRNRPPCPECGEPGALRVRRSGTS